MQLSFEQLEGLERKMTAEIPALRIEQEVENRLKNIASNARIDGFRRGKVPKKILLKRYGFEIRKEVLSEIIGTTINEAFEENDYKPVARPQITIESGFNTNELLKFIAIFEVAPEVTVNGLDELDIKLPQSEITEDDINTMIDTLLRQQATFSVKEGVAANDDRILIDYQGTIDGEAFDGGTSENVHILLGTGQMIAGFEDNLRGCSQGEQKTFNINFPEDYANAKIAGKEAQFSVTVKAIEKMQLPVLNGEFIKSFGIASGDEEDFKTSIKNNMQRELDNAARRIKRARLFEELLKHNDAQPLAKALLQEELERIMIDLNFERHFENKEQALEKAREIFSERARKKAILKLLINKILSDEPLELDKERLEQRLQEICATYEDSQEAMRWYKSNDEAKSNLSAVVLEEQLIDRIYQKATVSYEKVNFQELMVINSSLS